MNITEAYKRVLVIAFVRLVALKRAVVHVRVNCNITALTVVAPKSVKPSLLTDPLSRGVWSLFSNRKTSHCTEFPFLGNLFAVSIDPPRARKYHAVLEYLRGRWPTVSSPFSSLIANLPNK